MGMIFAGCERFRGYMEEPIKTGFWKTVCERRRRGKKPETKEQVHKKQNFQFMKRFCFFRCPVFSREMVTAQGQRPDT